MTVSDFDPTLVSIYPEKRYLLHFQWGNSSKVYRYALVEEINSNEIDPRLKQKKDEKELTQKEIWKNKYAKNYSSIK
jgi:hypothetical protein